MQSVDYHVGILRGYMLATNAHQTVLHALEVVLTRQREAGELIGQQPVEIQLNNLRHAASEGADQVKEQSSAFMRWSKQETEMLERLHSEGYTTREMVFKLPGRKYSQIYNKQLSLNLEPHGHKAVKEKEHA